MNVDNPIARSAQKLIGSDKPTLLSGSAALVAGLATRQLVTKAWRKWRGEEPPYDPTAASTGWGEAIAWTMALSVAVGTARLLARRGAAALERAY